ncbi:phenylacetic acid degradation protein PaaY [Ramlibacter monticola]|uniref:Transferase hexapeptide repeat family protein n=1 Tax=Ramlibacter monticola TaxID=1926872 RepID=A0A937CPC9_9BURK|nr:transferase hexapeptide repeat family protein [Ramlibacter monticola]MBL0389820.1 transferase hexapeptide repeat family protein [Ramlibacter monticola]
MPCYSIDGLIPVVDPTAYVHPTAVLTGDVVVGPDCYVGPCASLRGDFGRIVLEAGANVQDGCVLHSFPDAQVLVEADGHIGHGAVLHGCVVRRGALVGIKAVVMDGAEIGEQAMVAACAFVPAGTRVSARTLVAGMPAQPRRPLTEAEIARKHQGTLLYQELARRALATSRQTEPLAEPGPGRGASGS